MSVFFYHSPLRNYFLPTDCITAKASTFGVSKLCKGQGKDFQLCRLYLLSQLLSSAFVT